jgi:hypothetical protein
MRKPGILNPKPSGSGAVGEERFVSGSRLEVCHTRTQPTGGFRGCGKLAFRATAPEEVAEKLAFRAAATEQAAEKFGVHEKA